MTSQAPSSPEELTPEWMAEVLRSGAVIANEQRVTDIDVDVVGRGQGMTGRLARVALSYEPESEIAPRTVIAKFPAPAGPMRELTERFRLFERESRFYRELASHAGVPSPTLYYASDAEPSILLLEDLSDARTGDLGAGCSLDEARRLAGCLAKMHARWWGSQQLDALDWLPRPDDADTLEYADQVAGAAWKSFRRKAGELPPLLNGLGERLAVDDSVLRRLGSAPRTLVHGDMRINNVMWTTDGAVRAIIDWQTVTAGRGPIDIASLFVNNLRPEDRRIAERELLPEYHLALEAEGVEGYSYEDCWTDYRMALLNQFSQVIVISSLVDVGSEMDDEVAAATGMRMFTALLELDLSSLLPEVSAWHRWFSRAFAVIGR